MRKVFLLLFFLLLFFLLSGSVSFAQCTNTLTSATVTDPNGLPYSYGTITADIFPSPPGSMMCGSSGLAGHLGPIQLDANGSFSGWNIPQNGSITPAGTQWTFTVAESPGVAPPAGFGPVSFQVRITITSGTTNLSSTLSTSAPALSRTLSSGGAVSSVSGTANQINVSPTTGAAVVGFPATIAIPSGSTAPAINGLFAVDGNTYPLTEAGVQACINAAIAASGGAHTCDARQVGSITLASQLNVGNSSAQPVTLLLPQAATWSVSITNGTDCGIRQYNRSAIYGFNTATNAIEMILAPSSSSTNVEGLYCTEDSPSGGASYVVSEGFGVSNTVGATMGRGAFVGQHLFDGSQFRNIPVINSSGVGAKIYDACCATAFYNLLADGLSGSGARPLVIGDTVLGGFLNGGVLDVSFYSPSITHPGSGQFDVEIGDSTNSGANNSETSLDSFYNLYMEANSTDTTTPLVQMRPNVHGMSFHGFGTGKTTMGSTAYTVDIASWAGPSDSVFDGGSSSGSGNVINDHITGLTVQSDGSNNQARPYVSGPVTFGGLQYSWNGQEFSGVNTNNPTQVPLAASEFIVGRSSSGTLPTGVTTADLAFGFSGNFGGYTGGFRNWLSTGHTNTATGGYYKFYVNTSTTAAGSSAPGTGNSLGFSIYPGASGLPAYCITGTSCAAGVTLPTATNYPNGAVVIVNDATTFTPGNCIGGGSDTMLAVSNGSTWSCH